MPIKRYVDHLQRAGGLADYMQLLVQNFNVAAAEVHPDCTDSGVILLMSMSMSMSISMLMLMLVLRSHYRDWVPIVVNCCQTSTK